jgi:hypothetical protein
MSDFAQYRPEKSVFIIESPEPTTGTVARYHNDNFKVLTDDLVAVETVKLSKSGDTMSGALNMGTNAITNVTTINGGTIEIQGNKNQANGYPGLDSSGNLVGRILVGYAARSTFSSQTPAAGELKIASDEKLMYFGDGSTLGGNVIGKPYVLNYAVDISNNTGFTINPGTYDIIHLTAAKNYRWHCC